MKYIAAAIMILAYLAVDCNAQITPSQAEEICRQRQQEALDRRNREIALARLRAVSDQMYRGRPVPGPIPVDITELYREPTGTELRMIQPMQQDLVEYAAVLRQKSTGIVRLVPDAGCGDGTKFYPLRGRV